MFILKMETVLVDLPLLSAPPILRLSFPPTSAVRAPSPKMPGDSSAGKYHKDLAGEQEKSDQTFSWNSLNFFRSSFSIICLFPKKSSLYSGNLCISPPFLVPSVAHSPGLQHIDE